MFEKFETTSRKLVIHQTQRLCLFRTFLCCQFLARVCERSQLFRLQSVVLAQVDLQRHPSRLPTCSAKLIFPVSFRSYLGRLS